MADKEDQGGEEKEGGPSLLIPLVATAVISIATSVGLSMVLLGGEQESGGKKSALQKQEVVAEEEVELGEETYVSFQTFTINLEGKGEHVMLLEIDVSSRDAAALEALQKHMPAIRNDLNLLFSTQKHKHLQNNKGKERLMSETLRVIQKVMRKKIRRKGIDAVYFTKILTQ